MPLKDEDLGQSGKSRKYRTSLVPCDGPSRKRRCLGPCSNNNQCHPASIFLNPRRRVGRTASNCGTHLEAKYGANTRGGLQTSVSATERERNLVTQRTGYRLGALGARAVLLSGDHHSSPTIVCRSSAAGRREDLNASGLLRTISPPKSAACRWNQSATQRSIWQARETQRVVGIEVLVGNTVGVRVPLRARVLS
jgi:hypothetical protein